MFKRRDSFERNVKTLKLDQNAFDSPDSEESLWVVVSEVWAHSDIDEFLQLTHSDYCYPVAPKVSDCPVYSANDLRVFLAPFTNLAKPFKIPPPEGAGWSVESDWNHRDVVYATAEYFVRVRWETSA